MIWKSIWRIESTGFIAQVLFVIAAAILGSLGVYVTNGIGAVAGLALFLLIYRLRYKRL